MEKIRQEWAAFKALSFQKKLEHIWIYYKWFLISAVAVICVLVSVVQTMRENSKEILVSGIFVNNFSSQEGYDHLSQDYWEYCGGDENQKAELVTGRIIHFDAETLSQEDAAAFMIVSSMLAAKTLDYIITNQASLEAFAEQEVPMDLRELLPQETLSKWDTIEADGAVIGLKLEGTAFAEKYPLYAPDSCILVTINTQHRENVIQFLEYLRGEP